MSRAYQRVTFRGRTLNRRTVAMLEQAESVLLKGAEQPILQGSYNTTVSQSAGTHDGGGAIDLPWPGDSRKRADAVVRALRQVGFAAWVRPELVRNGKRIWGNHIHAIAIGDKDLSSGAAKQVQDYYAGQDGLASHARDNTWRPNPIPVFSYPLGTVHIGVAIEQAKANKKSARPAVRLIQRALNAKSGTQLVADGIYGPKTRKALSRYERQVGGDGDGIPGRFATELLGLGRFKVVD